MNGRHVLLVLAAAAVALCAVFVLRALDGGDPTEGTESVAAAEDPLRAVVRREPAAEPERTVPAGEPASVPQPPAEPVPEAGARTGLEEAEAALARLARLLEDRQASNEDLLGALTLVQAFYLHPPPPPGFTLHAVPEARTAGDRRLVHEANLRLLAEEERWPHDYVDEILKWRRRAEKLFLEALELQAVDREKNLNVREAVNIEAARVLASTANALLSRDIRRVLERTVLKARYEVTQTLYDEGFGALGTLGDPDSLKWLREEFTHARMTPKSKVDQLVAAHKAMLRFDREKVDGAERLEIVQEMIKTYSGVESTAARRGDGEQAQAARALWTRIGEGAIRVAQYYSFDPQSDDEEPLATMKEFQDWFRRHKNPQNPPWRDE